MSADLLLRRILAVGGDGIPVLEGENRRVITLRRLGHADAGRIAVCQTIDTQDDTLALLGLIEPHDRAAPDVPLVLRHGSSAIVLEPDGQIRMEGTELSMQISGPVVIVGERIDLN